MNYNYGMLNTYTKLQKETMCPQILGLRRRPENAIKCNSAALILALHQRFPELWMSYPVRSPRRVR